MTAATDEARARQPGEGEPQAPTAAEIARKDVWLLLEDWSARVPGKVEERAALCSIRAVTRMADKIDRIYQSALREARDEGAREMRRKAARIVDHAVIESGDGASLEAMVRRDRSIAIQIEALPLPSEEPK